MTLNDQIKAWLAQQGIATTDFITGQPEGEEDQILHWGDGMGPQPSAEQLAQAWASFSVASAKKRQIQAINEACERALSEITAPYPSSEALTWDQQLAEASAYLADSGAKVPLLAAISKAAGRSLDELAGSVLNANAAYKSASGAAIGRRQALTAQINSSTSVDLIAAINW